MRSAVLALLAFAGIAGYGEAAPRDASFFEANPEAAQAVLEDCARGVRSPESAAARQGQSRLRAKAQRERYREGSR